VDWIHLSQHRDQWRALVNKVMNLRVQWKAGNFWTSWVTISFSRRTLFHRSRKGAEGVTVVSNTDCRVVKTIKSSSVRLCYWYGKLTFASAQIAKLCCWNLNTERIVSNWVKGKVVPVL
jgi:hypothetical protein